MTKNQRTQRKIPELKQEYLERIKQLLPDKKDLKSYLDILKIRPVKSIRCNTLKISPEKLKTKLQEKGWVIKQPWKDYPEIMVVEGKIVNEKLFEHNKLATSKARSLIEKCGRDKREKLQKQKTQDLEPGELGRALEHLLGYYYIQELASMLPIIALKPQSEELILDLCAAPGSKTTQSASKMKNTGTILANELSMGRLKILASNIERCGITNTIITKKDGIAFCNRLMKYNPDFKFDKILLDAPCSGEGTLRSSPKTYIMWNPKTITSLSKLQKQLFKSAFQILKPGGEIIYSTCTHAPEENEAIVDWALKEFKDKIEIEKIKLPIKTRQGITEWHPKLEKENIEKGFVLNNKRASKASKSNRDSNRAGGPNKAEKKFNPKVKLACRIYPHDNNTEGFFIAKFKKLK